MTKEVTTEELQAMIEEEFGTTYGVVQAEEDPAGWIEYFFGTMPVIYVDTKHECSG